jgi:hypothetical protein
MWIDSESERTVNQILKEKSVPEFFRAIKKFVQ